jgi:hypothetical protein
MSNTIADLQGPRPSERGTARSVRLARRCSSCGDADHRDRAGVGPSQRARAVSGVARDEFRGPACAGLVAHGRAMTRSPPERRSHLPRDREVQRPALLVPHLDPKAAPHDDREANRAPRDHTRACIGRDLPMTNVNDVRRGAVGQGRSVRRAPAAGARPADHSGEHSTPPHPSDATPSASLHEPVQARRFRGTRGTALRGSRHASGLSPFVIATNPNLTRAMRRFRSSARGEQEILGRDCASRPCACSQPDPR